MPNRQSLGFMNTHPQPARTDFGSAHMSMLPGSLGGSQTVDVTQSSQNEMDYIMEQHNQTLLLDWRLGQQDPWNPIQGSVQERNPVLSNHQQTTTRPNPLTTYRNSHVPSEYETIGHGRLPSDSGYESLSRPRHSVIGSSVHGDCDRSGETASLSNGLAGIQFDQFLSPTVPWRQQEAAHAIDGQVNVDNKQLVCPTCNEKVKTRSEINKHKQKHEKPHRCPVADCIRTVGFSTTNDVDRHVRSCHPGKEAKGKTYVCSIPGCRFKDKRWPRADNFRSHLKRIHQVKPGEENIENYLYRPEQSLPRDLAGLGTSVEDGFNESMLSSGSWRAPTCKERASGSSNTFPEYSGQQDAAVVRRVVSLLHSSTAGDEVSTPTLHMPTFTLDSETGLSNVEPSDAQHCQNGLLEDLASSASNIDHGVGDFEGSCYFDEGPATEAGFREDGDNFVQPSGEAQSLGVLCAGPGDFERTTDHSAHGIGEQFFGSARGVSPEDTTTMHDDDEGDESSSLRISSPTASGLSERGDTLHVSRSGMTDHPEKSNTTEASLAGLDILNDNDQAAGLLKALEDKGSLEAILKELGYQKPAEVGAEVKTPHARTDVGKYMHKCPERGCGKSFPRACELTKHKKRHSKPYVCTYPPCDKRFGSKNDWRRHENSQHYQFELWRCDEKDLDPTKLCGKTYNRREQFKAHLVKDHKIKHDVTLNLKLESCLQDRHYEVSFWCGLCSKTILFKDRGPDADVRKARADHVEDHLKGQNGPKIDMSDWKHPASGVSELAVALVGSGDTVQDECPGVAPASSALAVNAERPPKRPADTEAPSSSPRKKVRLTAIWYCCGCHESYSVGFTTTCMSPRCQNHKICDHCVVDDSCGNS